MDQIIVAESPLDTSATAALASAKYAGFWRRFAAYFLDDLILTLGCEAVSWMANVTGNDIVILISLIVILILSFAYYIYFIGDRGQTPGKMILKIKVIRVDGKDTKIGYGKAFMREVIGKLVSLLVLGLGYLWMIWDPKKQTWQDKIAGTVVVKM